MTTVPPPNSDPAVVKAYADWDASEDAIDKANQDGVDSGNALLALIAKYPDFPGDLDINDLDAVATWFTKNASLDMPMVMQVLNNCATAKDEQATGVKMHNDALAEAKAAGIDVSNLPTDEVPPAVTQTLDDLNNVDIGADFLKEAQDAGSQLAVDLDGMDMSEMIMMVFAGANQAKENLTKEKVEELNQQNQDTGKLTDMMSQLNAKLPSSAETDDKTDVTIDNSVLDALKDDGVEMPDATANSDGTTSTLKADKLYALVQNIKSAIDTKSDNTQLAIQGITKCNNDIAENYQVMSSTQSDVHQSKMGLAAGH
jgi:hypothetical protein